MGTDHSIPLKAGGSTDPGLRCSARVGLRACPASCSRCTLSLTGSSRVRLSPSRRGCSSQSCPLGPVQLHSRSPAHAQHLRQTRGLPLQQPPAALRQGQICMLHSCMHRCQEAAVLRCGAGPCPLEMYQQCSGSLQLAGGSRACSAGSLPT